MFGSFGMMELLLILIIVLIIFGAGKLPQLGEGLGKAIKGFKKSVHEAEAVEEETTPPQPTAQPQNVVEQGTSSAQPNPGNTAVQTPAEVPTDRRS